MTTTTTATTNGPGNDREWNKRVNNNRPTTQPAWRQ
jgi:hypothetical protein